MKNSLFRVLVGILAAISPSCIYVHVTGDPEELWGDEGLWDDGDEDSGFGELSQAVGDSLADPKYDLDLEANPWRTEAEWTVRFASTGSDGHAAFHRAKEAVLNRIQREGGEVKSQRDEGPHDWFCEFRIDGEPCEAAVRLVENADEDSERPHQLEVRWEAAN